MEARIAAKEPVRVNFVNAVGGSGFNWMATIDGQNVNVGDVKTYRNVKYPLPKSVEFTGKGTADCKISVPLASVVEKALAKKQKPVVYLASPELLKMRMDKSAKFVSKRKDEVDEGEILKGKYVTKLQENVENMHEGIIAAMTMFPEQFEKEQSLFRWACEYLSDNSELSEVQRSAIAEWLEEVSR